ncbi:MULTISPECIES: glycoside hydrolase family 26 protein [Streptomyces]|uniref:Glycosyl hydrolase n=1 Tax=Streptomyces solicathayae TaxID=3081768 RepID=A0ABZ0LSC3_9ACTN|nr:glycosyl hydrolase [Streptomyces sp. HUAS YS2]WOX22390.1 glycosyl hydrolase [Streptomyces sp. HUAS YS2]
MTRPGASSARPRVALVVLLAALWCALVQHRGIAPDDRDSGRWAASLPPLTTPSGFFTGSDAAGVARIGEAQRWLGGGAPLTVGHTYLPGDLWSNIEGHPALFGPWARWKAERPGRMFVLNVPMLERNEAGLADGEVRAQLRRGAAGAFDGHFRTLGERLVAHGLGDAVLVLGWEMNGTTYSHRCAPDPAAWRAYWRRLVGVLRATPGERFRFDFTASRGRDAIPWPECYPGDAYVDIIGMDAYDQPEGLGFAGQVAEEYGLAHHVRFAAAHGKPVSYPEWGLFRNGDDPAYVWGMLDWFARHRPVYQTLTDYCPHGVWQCPDNPLSGRVVRGVLGAPARP